MLPIHGLDSVASSLQCDSGPEFLRKEQVCWPCRFASTALCIVRFRGGHRRTIGTLIGDLFGDLS